MRKCLLFCLSAAIATGGCKSSVRNVSVTSVQSLPAQYDDPPSFDPGIGVEDAYKAIPHRRTIWTEDGSTIPANEKAYLKVMFQVLDKAVAMRVVSMRDYSNGEFERVDADAEYGLLIKYIEEMDVPPKLAVYHKDIRAVLYEQQYVFRAWKTYGRDFWEKERADGFAGLRTSSAKTQAAYGELMAKYPGESEQNKDAFYDYHCALDFM